MCLTISQEAPAKHTYSKHFTPYQETQAGAAVIWRGLHFRTECVFLHLSVLPIYYPPHIPTRYTQEVN